MPKREIGFPRRDISRYRACPMTRTDLPSEWLEQGLARRGMTQADLARAMERQGVHVTPSEISRWKSSRYARSPKVEKVYDFLYADMKEPGPTEEAGLRGAVEAMTAALDQAVRAGTEERTEMARLIGELSDQLGELHDLVRTLVASAGPGSGRN